MSDWINLADELPPAYPETFDFKLDDGSVVERGWRVFDGILQRHVYWCFSDKAKKPSRYTSTLQKHGVAPIQPVAWRKRASEKVVVPHTPISRREAETLFIRAILTDGTTRNFTESDIQSSWDSSIHIESGSIGDYVGHEGSLRVRFFEPDEIDLQNYIIGMTWFAALHDNPKGWNHFNQEQKIVILKAYRFQWVVIGDKLRIGERRVARVYKEVIGRVWEWANRDIKQVRRLPKARWQEGVGKGRKG